MLYSTRKDPKKTPAEGGLFWTGSIYGAGILAATGQPAAIDARFMRLRLADGNYDRNNQQVGNPRQIQFALRFFF